MIYTLRAIARRIVRKITPPVRASRVRFRPGLESLGDRVVPTVNHWLGTVSADFDTSANWSQNHVPVAGEDVWFVPTLGPGGAVSNPCDGMHAPSGGGAYNSVFLDNGYTETVTLDQGFDTKALILLGGTIDQPTSGTDITVTGNPTIDGNNTGILSNRSDFHWTAGTLNSTSHLATLVIDGATATIAPVNAGTVTSGTQLNFENGAEGEVLPGETYFDNGAGIDVGAGSAVEVKPTASATVTHNSNVNFDTGVIYVATGGFYTVTGPNNFTPPGAIYTAKMPLVNDGGTVTVQGGATLSVQGRIGGSLPDEFPYLQLGGLTQIENGSILKATVRSRDTGGILTGVVDIRNGTFSTTHHSLLLDSQQEAIVDGGFLMSGSGADLIIGYGGTVLEVFRVTGPVSWDAGTYHPLVNASDTAKSSLWIAGGQFSVANGVSIVPIPIGTPTSNQTWKIMECTNGITGTMPQISGWTLLAPNPATEWDLKKN